MCLTRNEERIYNKYDYKPGYYTVTKIDYYQTGIIFTVQLKNSNQTIELLWLDYI